MKFFARLIVNAFSLLLIAYILPGIQVEGIFAAFIAALLIGLGNAIIRPVLIVLTLPVTILTLGLFIFVINASIFFSIASIVDGFHVSGFLSALLGSILLGIVSSILHKFV